MAKSESTTVAIPEGSAALPELYDSADMADIQLPEIRVQQKTSDMVENGTTKFGDVVLSLGSDDVDPVFLIGGPEKRESFKGYIIGRKKFAASTGQSTGDGFHFHQTAERDEDDPDSWVGYFFMIALPEFDRDIPARIMLWRSGRFAAKKINFFVAKALKEQGPAPHVSFGVERKENAKGSWYQLTVQLIQADEGLADALEMAKFGKLLSTENDAPVQTGDSTLPPI
jgi:hypothetical protein